MYKRNCTSFISILIGIISGIIVGYNVYLALIPEIVIGLWVGLGIGLGTLLILFLTSLFICGRKESCICENGNNLIISALGTIVTTIIGLSITIVPESIGIAILIGLATLFLIMTLLTIVKTIYCLVNINCRCKE